MSNTSISIERELPSLEARRRSLFWRIHFWAALIASPFALMAALTGILYIFTPQIEHVLYDRLDHVAPTGSMRPLAESIAAARIAVPPDALLRSVVPALTAGDSVKVFFMLPGAQKTMMDMGEHATHQDMPATMKMANKALRLPHTLTVYVDPYRASVLGMHRDKERFGAWSKNLHSSLLQGKNWRWMIELAASWLMVMLLSGVYLWWPRGRQSGLPQKGAKGRTAWVQWHSFIGVALCAMSFVMLTTGLTWSRYAGDQVRLVRDAIGQKPPQTPPDLVSQAGAGLAPMDWQAAADAARRQAPEIALRLTPPRNDRDVWRITNYDLTQPKKRIDMALDAYSGKALFHADWKDQTAFSQATGIGIPFHRGEFGWWNQLLLLLFGLGVIFSLVSGWIMFFKRRKAGTSGPPKLLPGAWRSASFATWFAAALMCMAMPLLALSGALVVVLEIALHYRQRHHA